MKKTYSEAISFLSFEERFRYLKLDGKVGIETFGFNRYANQQFYQSLRWRKVRDEVIIRDMACDLAFPGREMNKYILIHHINPISFEDILNQSPNVFDLENLICVSKRTHNAIHFSDESALALDPVIRMPNDTCPWK